VSIEDVVHQSPLMYRVLRDANGALLIEVVVGGIALSTVRVSLDEREAAAWASEGSTFGDRLAREIMADPPFGGRSYEV
jgi:hypothetical protein